MEQQREITPQYVAALKDEWEGYKLIYIGYQTDSFIFRTLNRKEYKFLLAGGLSTMDLEDAICNAACLYPEGMDFGRCGYAGLVEIAANHIKEESGFLDITDVMNTYKTYSEYNNMEIQCMDLIKAFIPEYTYTEMEEWTWDYLMYMTVRAERVAHMRGYEWELKDETEEFVENLDRINSSNPEFLKELENNGIDPMYYFEDEIKNLYKKDVIDFPLIGGAHWKDEEILNAIRKQLNTTSSG